MSRVHPNDSFGELEHSLTLLVRLDDPSEVIRRILV